MIGYGRNNFTWNGSLRELGGSCPVFCAERRRTSMTAITSSCSGLEVLLSTLQNAGDVESTLNVLKVLDELLSAGTDRRFHYMISKGGSEALLTALVKFGRSFSPNYTVLLPLLQLLAKVGYRDCRIGMKAEEAGAVLLTLNLLRHNVKDDMRAAACLWAIQVFSSSVSTANLIGENHGLDVIFSLIPHYTTKHLHTIKAAIHAFSALLGTKANVRSVVSKGYISGLLQLYKDWHSKDTQHVATAICHVLLCCLHKLTHITAGRQAFITEGGLALLYQTTQTCLLSKCLESLVEPSMQLMRKCLPRTPLPLPSDLSAYTFPLPGKSNGMADVDAALDESGKDSDEDDENNQNTDSRDYDEDLETDLNKLLSRPDPDRPKYLLPYYSFLCPELSHDFQELDLSSESEESSSSSSLLYEEDMLLHSLLSSRSRRRSSNSSTSSLSSHTDTAASRTYTDTSQIEACDVDSQSSALSTSPSIRTMVRAATDKDGSPGQRKHGQDDEVEGPEEESHYSTTIDRLLEKHGPRILHHEPKLYCSTATKTKSIPGFNVLAFPDFWGHLPPPGCEPMPPRKANIQRQKVFQDIQRFLNLADLINEVVFDLEDSSVESRCDSLKFFSKFECGNLRKAVQVRRYEYDLILNADANCSQHTQWFYFEVSNMVADTPYRFNVINCEKSNSQFNYGMQPVLYSVKEALEGRPHWVHLKVLQQSVDPATTYFRQQNLCGSLAGNMCPVVTITAYPAKKAWKDMHQLRNRPCILLTGRVHPGESNASWVMKGTLEFLCSNDPVAQSLREAFIFKIIPMLNPDGVINGMNRCDLNGKDLNRQWCKPDPILSPTIYHTKGFLYYLNSIGRTPLIFCDYHGHSRKKNVFLYGCSVKETLWQSGSTVDTVGLKEDPGYRTLAKILDRIAPSFSINSCNYLVEKSRSATARVVVWREIGVLRSYTMESTYNGCDQGIYKGLQTGTREMQEMGAKFCHSLLSLIKDTKAVYSTRLIKHVEFDHASHNCFEDDEPPCVEEIEYSTNCCALKDTDLDSEVDTAIAD